MAKVEFSPDNEDDVVGTIVYVVGGIISGFFFVPEDGWLIGIIKSFFWLFVLMWKGIVWLWYMIF